MSVINTLLYFCSVLQIKRFFDFYINSSIHVAISSTALVYLTFIKMDSEPILMYVMLNFFYTVVGYNVVKYLGISDLYYRRLIPSLKDIWIVTIFCFIGMVFCFFQLSFKLLWLLLPFGVVTLMYTIPFLPGGKNLRNIAGSKIFIIAIVWSGTSVIVPAYYVHECIGFDIGIESLQRFIFVLVWMLPFEIRDLSYDPKTLKTIPQRVGVKRTKMLGSLVLILFFFLNYLKRDVDNSNILADLIISFTMLFFLWKSSRQQTTYYCSFWVESIPVIWVFVLISISIL